MGGFSTPVLEMAAGQPLRLRIDNPDTPYHSDGGGWHQLAIPALGVDARVAPRSDKVVEIPAAEPGEYAFYCDVCCGGKENPSMQGVLRVTA
jgi:cytochrome c oxidase subunit II